MLEISIIIPCKNEEKFISRCINALLNQKGVILEREIIVVDNGSTDNTLKILESFGSDISYYVRSDLSIAGLRNFGVEKSTKEWIGFIDADVEVDRDWAKNLVDFLRDQEKKGTDIYQIITGSTCLVPENPTWIEQIWYQQLIFRDSATAKYINSGNMVIHRDLFNRVGGFNTSFKTGEEEKLCEEARRNHNGILMKNEKMIAVHHGYPKTVPAFFKRMRWHGMGMKKYLFTPWKSKPLLLAIYYLLSAVIFLTLFFLHRYSINWIFILLGAQFAPVLFYAASRCSMKIKNLLQLTFLFFCFGWARAISLFDMLFRIEIIQQK